MFLNHFPNPEKLKKGREKDPYGTIKAWFSGGNKVEILNDSRDADYRKALDSVVGLKKMVEAELKLSGDELYTYMELLLHGLSEFNIVNKDLINSNFTFRDLLANMLNEEDMFGDLDEE
jgi:magnesium chelatase subunit I